MSAARSVLGVILPIGLLVTVLLCEAEPAGRVPRIGYLCPSPCGGPRRVAFVDALRQLGYVDGRNIAIVYPRYSASEPNDVARLPEVAAQLIRQEVDIIFAAGWGNLAARAARSATRTIPVVVAVPGDPVRLGLVASLARPGGNVTGVTYLEDVLVVKALELLKEVVPAVSRVGALMDEADPDSAVTWQALERAAGPLGVQLDPVRTRAPTNFEDAFIAIAHARVGALVVFSSPNHFLQLSRLAHLSLQKRLPAASTVREFAEARGLMAYGPHVGDMLRRAASFVDRILKGARPGDLPVEQPTRFELVVNLRTAKELRLTIPPSVLARVDELIE
jgi:putative tryptophan/tyrosine transport system substrate-binding protein